MGDGRSGGGPCKESSAFIADDSAFFMEAMMGAPLLEYRPAPREYLEMERKATARSEYLRGRIRAMAGAGRRHSIIAVNVASGLNVRLKEKPCQVYAGDMRLKVTATGLYTYPDVVAVCGEPAFEDAHLDTLLNPLVIVEVLCSDCFGGRSRKKASRSSIKPGVAVAPLSLLFANPL